MSTSTPPSRGRPRDETRDVAILDAALRLIAEHGYERVSMEAIATEAKAGKATLYRRWPSKAALVAEAMRARVHHDRPAFASCGELRRDLVESLAALAERLQAEELDLVAGLLNAMRRDAVLAAEVRSQIVGTKQEEARQWAAQCFPADASADVQLVHSLAPALFLFRLLLTGEPVDGPFIEHLVDEVLLPLLRQHSREDRT